MSSVPASAHRPRTSLQLITLALLAAASAASVACGGTEPPAGTGGAGGTGGAAGTGGGAAYCDAAPIFAAQCGTQFCHGSSTASAPVGGIELVTPPAGMTLGQSLYNKPAMYNTGALGCPTTDPEIIIDSTNPAASLLLNKITGTKGVDFACGDKMPTGSVMLSATDLSCVTEWVNGVASTGGI
jgi:hypothetical protein